jgi:hypothetical protein
MATIGPPKPQPIPCATNAVTGQDNSLYVNNLQKDPIFLNEKESLLELVKNSRIVLSVEQEILAILQAQKG